MMSDKKSLRMDMVHGPLLKNIIEFAVPMMLASMLQMMFSAADTIIVGKFAGELALAAVGATGSLCFLLVSLFNGLSGGSNVVIATLLGKQDEEGVQKAVHTSITMATVGGVLMAFVGFFLAKPMLHMMATPSDIIDLSTLYMRLYFVGCIFMFVYNFGSSILRSKGDTKRPMYYLAISGALNVALNVFFVVVLQISVAGVAIATVISQAVAAGLTCARLMRDQDVTHLDLKKLGIDTHIAWEIIRIGVPAGIQGMVFSLSNVVIQSSINSFNSSTIVAGNSAGNSVEGFVYIGMMAFSQATITFTGQNVGAKNYGRVKSIMYITMLLSCIGSLTLGFGVWYFGDFFLGLYTNEPLVIEVGMIRLTWVALPLILNGILDIFICSMRGMGHSTFPTIVMIVGICGIRFLWLGTYFLTHRTLEAIYMCFPVSWTITSIILGILWVYCYKKLMKESTSVC